MQQELHLARDIVMLSALFNAKLVEIKAILFVCLSAFLSLCFSVCLSVHLSAVCADGNALDEVARLPDCVACYLKLNFALRFT